MIDAKFKLASQLAKKTFEDNKVYLDKVSDFRKRSKEFVELRNKIQHWTWVSPGEYSPQGDQVRPDLPMAIMSKVGSDILLPQDLSNGMHDIESRITILSKEIGYFSETIQRTK